MLFGESLDLVLTLEGYTCTYLRPELHTSHSTFLHHMRSRRPDVVLLDVALGETLDGRRLIPPLAEAHVDVVVVTASHDPMLFGECLALGARTALSKTVALTSVVDTIRRLQHGHALLGLESRQDLVDRWRTEATSADPGPELLARLTPRETDVLRMLMSGRGVSEIARHEVVAEHTVRTQVKTVLSKLEVSSQLAAVAIGHQAGWRPINRAHG